MRIELAARSPAGRQLGAMPVPNSCASSLPRWQHLPFVHTFGSDLTTRSLTDRSESTGRGAEGAGAIATGLPAHTAGDGVEYVHDGTHVCCANVDLTTARG
jgi:hypothetical protein